MLGFRIKNRKTAISKRRLRGSLAIEATIALTCLIILAVCGVMAFRIITFNSAIHYASTQSLVKTNEVLVQLSGVGAFDNYQKASTGSVVSDEAVRQLQLSMKGLEKYKKWTGNAPDCVGTGIIMKDPEVYFSYDGMTALADGFFESKLICEYCQYDFVNMAKDYRAAWNEFLTQTGHLGKGEYEQFIQKLYAYNMRNILESYIHTEISTKVMDSSGVMIDNWTFSMEDHVLHYSCDVTYTINLPLPFVKIKAKTVRKHVLGVVNLVS